MSWPYVRSKLHHVSEKPEFKLLWESLHEKGIILRTHFEPVHVYKYFGLLWPYLLVSVVCA